MIKPNWEIFKAKFSENSRSMFEWFCYLLFCKEFDQPHGIFRFKNQSAIETNPINNDDEVIGWQAKFYDTTLPQHKDDLVDTIETAKRDYPEITKLLFYTNQEWGQNKGKKPKGLIEIEAKSKELNIILEWRMASFFESEFVSIKNELFAKHFFILEKSVFSLIEEQEKHTENILREIQTSISFSGIDFKINRNKQLEQLKDTSQKISILSGAGGVGKTALIKDLYTKLKDEVPFFVFKATEFELININYLFKDFSLYDFAKAYEGEKNKIVVIDSSEKLLDLKNSDPIKEFLSVLINDQWKIIFTTRNNYLEDLNHQFFDIYCIAASNIIVNNLDSKELSEISRTHSFLLPRDEKLLDLIKNPFYLNEYQQFYNDNLEYREFKNRLWNKNIKKSNPERERCFLEIAFKRATTGQFFISPSCGSSIVNNGLLSDGILGNEIAGYFITHDIYEEWALENIIESEFIKKANNQDFFEKLGQALPIRRSFRNWLSEKLLLKDGDIKKFIQEIIKSEEIAQFWKDEILVSVLLSGYSKVFFDFFKGELLSDEQNLLRKITFILRIACKEVADDFLKKLGIKDVGLLSIEHVFTKPKGQGWDSLIKFIFDNIEAIGIKNINFILPVIYDWNSNVKEGETTRLSSLIALRYYQWTINDNIYLSSEGAEEHLLQTIIYGSSEIKDELKNIFDQILKHKWKNYRDPYYKLSKIILTKLEGISVSKVLPENVLELANLFWSYTKKDKKDDTGIFQSEIEIEEHFGLECSHSDYSQASAYQTPIYWLLQSNFKRTIDFILNFTNRSVQKYATSGFDSSVQHIEFYLDIKNKQSQYMSPCLWNLYRGASSPRSPYLLQSIHMALEKYFLEVGEIVESNILERWLIYILKNSHSASISSVVVSIVLAYPDKTFNVAKILFKVKEFILNDSTRLVGEREARSSYSIAANLGPTINKVYDEERIKTCEDKHRKFSLENQFLEYQLFRKDEKNDSEALERQKALWKILDDYYQELPIEPEQSESDKIWRLSLARMDRRKMNPQITKTKKSIYIQLNPDIDSNLKSYSDKSLEKSSEYLRFIPLKMWAEHKFNKDDKCKQYDKYDNNPKASLIEVKEIIRELSEAGRSNDFKTQHSEEQPFLYNDMSIPVYVCSILLRDYFDQLSKEDRSFCKDITFSALYAFINLNYHYQVSDGVEQVISILPNLLKIFPEETEKIKIILLLSLFDESDIGNKFAIKAHGELWESSFNDADSLFIGYFFFKEKYDKQIKSIREDNYRKGVHGFNSEIFLQNFIKENEEELQSVIDNKLSFSHLKDIEKNGLSTLRTAFRMIPHKTDSNNHKRIAKKIISIFSQKLVQDGSEDKINHQIKSNFLHTYTDFVLNLHAHEIEEYLKPFLDNFNASKLTSELLREFILSECHFKTYDNFWVIWDLFREKIVNICKDSGSNWYVDDIVKSYLFATVPYQGSGTKSYYLKDKDKKFFGDLIDNIGYCPSCLYAISKLLNDIGSHYIDDGVDFISGILGKNPELSDKKLEDNTIYYLENFTRKYTFRNREIIKKNKSKKDKLLLILDYLIDKGSFVGYMLRENVL